MSKHTFCYFTPLQQENVLLISPNAKRSYGQFSFNIALNKTLLLYNWQILEKKELMNMDSLLFGW